MLGKQIAHYRIEKLLGEGGMGSVYLAKDLKNNRLVAIKSLFSHLALQPTVLERFRHEASTMAGLHHLNVVQLHDFIDNDGLYLVMEYVEGEELSDYIIRKPIAWEQAVEMFLQILDAVSYAHRRGIIHRDLKPSNIMISKTGVVKVLDFGVAKLIDETSPTLTRTGAKIGTVLYMSPEQIKGQPVDIRADIYSLGVTFFQMLTGESPYNLEQQNEFDISLCIVNNPLPRIQLTNNQLPEALQEIIDKATAKNPSDRYQSCYELAEALHTIIAKEEENLVLPTNSPEADESQILENVNKPFSIKIFLESHKNIILGVFIIFIVVLIGFNGTKIRYFLFKKTHTETEIKARVYEYYKAIETHEFDQVKPFYAPQIERYFTKKNQVPVQIQKILEAYWQKTPKEEHAIAWDTFAVSFDEKGNYVVRFLMDYHYQRASKGWQERRAKTEILFDNNLKIYSVMGVD